MSDDEQQAPDQPPPPSTVKVILFCLPHILIMVAISSLYCCLFRHTIHGIFGLVNNCLFFGPAVWLVDMLVVANLAERWRDKACAPAECDDKQDLRCSPPPSTVRQIAFYSTHLLIMVMLGSLYYLLFRNILNNTYGTLFGAAVFGPLAYLVGEAFLESRIDRAARANK